MRVKLIFVSLYILHNRLREDFELPPICTLSQFTSKVKVLMTACSYTKHIFTNLNDSRQTTCLLMLDEVYVKATLHDHGGVIFGNLVNKLHLLDVDKLHFMILTLIGGPKFLSKMLFV